METLISYHGDHRIKAKYLRRVREHRKADDLVQGATGHGGKGCAVWCTFNAYDHSRYPAELGVPQEIARLEDSIFEGLTVKESQKWPERFLKAIPVGKDLSMVWPRFAAWMLSDLETKFAGNPKVTKACGDVAALYHRWITVEKPAIGEWRAARIAAADAAAYAAAYASAAADAASYAAASAAADAASYAAADAAARKAFWRSAADKLEELLRAS